MDFPVWVLKHKQKGVEIRKLGSSYYLYQIKSVWDKEKKRARKITVKFLGTITEAGLIKPKHERVIESLGNISVKEFGSSYFILKESQDILQNLKLVFPECWSELFSFAVCRFFHTSPLKNVQHHHYASHLSDVLQDASVSPKTLSSILHEVGGRRDRIRDFLSKYMVGGASLVVDLTNVFSLSEGVISATLGHNSHGEYVPQIKLFLVFSADTMQPVFYRLLVGSIPDVSSLLLTMEEGGISNVILVGDKSFHSAENVTQLDGRQIKYVFPLKRNSHLIDYSPFNQAGKKGFGGHFLFENRVIWHYERTVEGRRVVTFLDEKLKVEEERDFLIRVDEKKLELENFHANEHKFGTISIITKTGLHPQKLFEMLKSRVEIESLFDTFKNTLNADRSYMRDDTAMEGWMFVNFIALLLYYKVYALLMKNNLLNKYSPKDIILHLSRIFKIKIGDHWRLSEIPKKSRVLSEKLGIEMHIT